MHTQRYSCKVNFISLGPLTTSYTERSLLRELGNSKVTFAFHTDLTLLVQQMREQVKLIPLHGETLVLGQGKRGGCAVNSSDSSAPELLTMGSAACDSDVVLRATRFEETR